MLLACLPMAAAALSVNGEFGKSPLYWQPSGGNGPTCLGLSYSMLISSVAQMISSLPQGVTY
jgi:hypothetical protein